MWADTRTSKTNDGESLSGGSLNLDTGNNRNRTEEDMLFDDSLGASKQVSLDLGATSKREKTEEEMLFDSLERSTVPPALGDASMNLASLKFGGQTQKPTEEELLMQEWEDDEPNAPTSRQDIYTSLMSGSVVLPKDSDKKKKKKDKENENDKEKKEKKKKSKTKLKKAADGVRASNAFSDTRKRSQKKRIETVLEEDEEDEIITCCELEDDDTLEKLGEKLERASKANLQFLGEIQSKKNKRVTSGFRCTLRCTAKGMDIQPSSEENEDDVQKKLDRLCKFQSTAISSLVEERVHAWEYKGEALTPTDDIFNDNIDYSLHKFPDLVRLCDQVPKVGNKYASVLSDRPRTRDCMKQFLKNMKVLNDAVVEVHALTDNLPNPFKEKEELEEGMENLVRGFQQISKMVPEVKVDLDAEKYVGTLPTDYFFIRNPEGLEGKTTLEGHEKVVSALEVYEAENKKFLVSASEDTTMSLWDLKENTKLATLPGAPGQFIALTAFQMEGAPYLASKCVDDDKSIQVWDLTKRIHRTLQGHSSTIFCLTSYSFDGKTFVISGGMDKTIKIWDVSKMECIGTLEGHDSHVYSLMPYPTQGTIYLASGSNDRTVKLWNLDNQTCDNTLTGHEKYILAMAFYRKKNWPRLASAGGDHNIKLWDLALGSIIWTMKGHEGIVRTLKAFEGDAGWLLASGADDFTIRVWNLANWNCVREIKLDGEKVVCSMALYREGFDTKLVTGKHDGGIVIWSE